MRSTGYNHLLAGFNLQRPFIKKKKKEEEEEEETSEKAPENHCLKNVSGHLPVHGSSYRARAPPPISKSAKI
jgi:hypothetical protein